MELNSTTIFVILIFLSIMYFWALASAKKPIKLEIVFFFFSALLVGGLFFGSDLLELSLDKESSSTVSAEEVIPTETPETEQPKIEPAKPFLDESVLLDDAQPPVIEILFPTEGQIFPAETEEITVEAEISDDLDPQPVVDGVGPVRLKKGFNPLTVVAVDAAGNAASAFVIVERK